MFPGCGRSRKTCWPTPRYGGARAVNQETTIGTLEVGKKADLFVLDTQPYLVPAVPHPLGVDPRRPAADIESVMVDGQFVMRGTRS